MELLAGCYEQVLFGFAVRPGGRAWAPAAGFTHHAHSACLTAVAAGGRFAVTGSKDETIHIYDLRRRRDHGALVHHRGSVTCLRFHGGRHLLSGAEDGLICVWDARRWECLKTLRAHRGHVTCLAVHPSGKLALSVGTDKTLRTWNLVEGRSAFVKNIKQNAHIVEWSPGGEKYVVAVQSRIDVYRLATAAVSGTITCARRVSALAFLSESVLAVASDEEVMRVFDCDSQLCLCEWRAHENRVKDVCSLEVQGQRVLVTASSDGFIKAWQFGEDTKVPPALLCAVNTSARLTCVAVWQDGAVGSGAGQPPGAEPSPVSREQPEVCEEEEEEEEVEEEEEKEKQEKQSSEPSTKKRGRKAARRDRLGPGKRRKPMAELEKSNRRPVAGGDGLESAQQEATDTPEKRTRKPASGDAVLGSAKRKRVKLRKRDSKAAGGGGLGPARKRAGLGV